MWIKIQPFDTLFFRTPRPFSLGLDSWAELIFPPYPSTLYGAIRSFLIFRKGKLSDFYNGNLKDEAVGSPDRKGTLRINGIFVLKDETPVFRVPMDLVKIKGEKDGKARLLERASKPPLMISNCGLDDVLMWKGKEAAHTGKGWLGYGDFLDYVEGKSKEFSTVKEIFLEEPKIGIKRDRKSLSSKERMLYRVHMIRLNEGISIGTEISGVSDFPEKGVFQLGGEGKSVFFERINDSLEKLKKVNFSFENKVFKLYLATPAIFKTGWIPEWINPSSLEGEKDGAKIKLIACAIGRSVPIGGWDLAKGKPKTLRRAVPEGSVYYFKIMDNSDPEKVKTVFHLNNISDYLSEEGFGFSILGEGGS